MELLSPAGSYESLIAAVQSGADAVYLGGEKFGARQSASNFTIDEMKKWTDYCHLYGVKVYVTVNTLIKDSELEELAEYITDLAQCRIDGVIVQDLGAASVIRTVAPELEIHASTQMTVTTVSDAELLENLGFTRIVLSRELTIDEIKTISNSTSCEIEVFVHGALCMSYSGQCLMSSIIGGRSGNRGRCAQPCRLPYTLEGDGGKKSGFLLSPKDLCLVNMLDQLKKAGVDSLKIEGRLKRAGYVSTVVGIYRACIDGGRKATSKEFKELQDAFGRGFTVGFCGGETGRKMMNPENSSNVADNVFTDDAKARCRADANIRKVSVSIKASAKSGCPLRVSMVDTDGNEVQGESEAICQEAINKPVSSKRIEESLLKLGGSIYTCTQIEVEADENISIPISAINAVRRIVCEKMDMLRTERPSLVNYTYEQSAATYKNVFTDIYCEVNTKEQYDAAKSLGIKNIIAPASICGENDIIRYGFVSKVNTKKGKRAMVSAIGQLADASEAEIIGSSRLNITNHLSAEFYRAFMKKAHLSAELSLKEISGITEKTELECGVIAYGRLDLMLTANCPVNAVGKCNKGKSLYYLKDRKGEEFPLICSDNCAMRVLNSKPIFMADKWNDIIKSGVTFATLVFTDETGEDCERVIKTYLDAMSGKAIQPMKENTFTRGHFYRGVL